MAYKCHQLNVMELLGSELPILPPFRGLNIRGELNKRLSKPIYGKPKIMALSHSTFEKIKEMKNVIDGKASR